MKNCRIYDNEYTLPVLRVGGVNYTPSTPVYFGQNTFIEGKTIKSISAFSNLVPLGVTGDCYYITLFNTKGEQLLYNYPVDDLNNTQYQNANYLTPLKLRLFNLKNVDLRRSYFISSFNTPAVNTFEAFRLTFYF
jgi:hypothetical protein